MSVDVAETAKKFEEHAKSGYIPDVLYRELHNLSDEDRKAVAKQISWDMQQSQQKNPKEQLPKIEFYDSGDVKSVEREGDSGKTHYKNHYDLDKDKGYVKSETETLQQKDSPTDSYTSVVQTEHDERGHLTHKIDNSVTVHGTNATVNSTEDTWKYDSKTGKETTHDRNTSWGEKRHEEFDATTGKQKSADIVSKNGHTQETYDATTGKIKSSHTDYEDKTYENKVYNTNGDLISRERSYANNAVNRDTYSPRTGKMVHRETTDSNGTRKYDIDENGKMTKLE